MELKGKILPLMVLVEPTEKVEQTETGIIIPEMAQEAEMKGTVAKVGEATPEFPMVVTEGDEILFHHAAGMKVKIEGVHYRLLNQRDVFYIY